MQSNRFGKLLAFGLALHACAAAACNAADQQKQTSFSFCYQDIELYPNYTGNSAEIPQKDPGILIELVQIAAKNAAMDVEFLRYPWKRCLSLMKLGRVDSVVASFRLDRQDALVYPMLDSQPDTSRMIIMNGYYLYQKKEREAYWDGTSFLGPHVVIGAPLGYSITATLKEQGLNIVEAGTTEGLLHMLLYDRLQAVAAPGAAADTLLRQNAATYGSITKVAAPLRLNHYYLTFSHQFYSRNPGAVERLWAASPKAHTEHFEALQMKYALPTEAQAMPPTP